MDSKVGARVDFESRLEKLKIAISGVLKILLPWTVIPSSCAIVLLKTKSFFGSLKIAESY